jgi:hypothetical protein
MDLVETMPHGDRKNFTGCSLAGQAESLPNFASIRWLNRLVHLYRVCQCIIVLAMCSKVLALC